MNYKDFLDFYNNNLKGKYYCHEENVVDSYHCERVSRGYDHLGFLGYEDIRVIDSCKKEILRDKINRSNVVDIVKKIVSGKGYISEVKDGISN